MGQVFSCGDQADMIVALASGSPRRWRDAALGLAWARSARLRAPGDDLLDTR